MDKLVKKLPIPGKTKKYSYNLLLWDTYRFQKMKQGTSPNTNLDRPYFHHLLRPSDSLVFQELKWKKNNWKTMINDYLGTERFNLISFLYPVGLGEDGIQKNIAILGIINLFKKPSKNLISFMSYYPEANREISHSHIFTQRKNEDPLTFYGDVDTRRLGLQKTSLGEIERFILELYLEKVPFKSLFSFFRGSIQFQLGHFFQKWPQFPRKVIKVFKDNKLSYHTPVLFSFI